MSELIVSYIVLNGISFTYTAVYIMNTIKFYAEIQNKLGYLWMNKAPTKSEVKLTLQYLNNSSEIIGNCYNVVNTNKDYNKQPNTNTQKKISNSKSMMSKRIKYFFNFIENVLLSRQEARDTRRIQKMDKRQQRLDAYRLQLDTKKDQLVESQMSEHGYARCCKCKTYISPSDILQSIADNIVKLPDSILKKYTDVDLVCLITNKGRLKPRTISELKPYTDALTGTVTLKCNSITCRLPRTYNIDDIIMLQRKQIDLIYINVGILEYEAGI